MKGIFGGTRTKYSKSVNALDNFVPRKLGPRDIGRVHGYKGTKWDRKLFNGEFLEEKLDFRSTSAQFERRKRANPVKHKQSVDEIGIAADFHKPEYANNVLRDMKFGQVGWMTDKPMARRNIQLDLLKGTKIQKGLNVSDISSPIGWTPIKYKYKNDNKDFLAEHFWFDGSGVQFDFQKISQVLNCLPPQKQLQLNKQPAPTGYESKLNWLKMLLNMVTEERAIILKEDALHNQQEEEQEQQQEQQQQQQQEQEQEEPPPPIIDIIDEEKESESAKSSSSSSESENELDIFTKRSLYKTARNRSNTTLANSILSSGKPMTPRTRKRTLSRQDVNRRRFMSQESLDSIQAAITALEMKQREQK